MDLEKYFKDLFNDFIGILFLGCLILILILIGNFLITVADKSEDYIQKNYNTTTTKKQSIEEYHDQKIREINALLEENPNDPYLLEQRAYHMEQYREEVNKSLRDGADDRFGTRGE